MAGRVFRAPSPPHRRRGLSDALASSTPATALWLIRTALIVCRETPCALRGLPPTSPLLYRVADRLLGFGVSYGTSSPAMPLGRRGRPRSAGRSATRSFCRPPRWMCAHECGRRRAGEGGNDRQGTISAINPLMRCAVVGKCSDRSLARPSTTVSACERRGWRRPVPAAVTTSRRSPWRARRRQSSVHPGRRTRSGTAPETASSPRPLWC